MSGPVAVDITSWWTESLPETANSGTFESHSPPVWITGMTSAELGNANGSPSVLCGLNPALGHHMEGKMKVRSDTNDDDYFGFVVGFSPGDFTNSGADDAEYYLIDWKQRQQYLPSTYNPCDGTGMDVPAGLVASRVNGQPVESEFWAHTDYVSDTCTGGGVTKLVEGDNFGTIGWETDRVYDFCLEVGSDYIKLSIDDVEEIKIEVTVDATSPFCFYTFSQDHPKWYDITIEPLGTPGSCGDPHFKTWHHEHFEYHGQCDLVLAKDPSFADGLGMDVHIRTKLVRYWSYIKNAVIRIGNDVLEIEGSATEFDPDTHYWVNYEYQGELTEFAGFPVTMFSQQGTAVTKNRIEIDLSSKYPGQKIVLSTYKEFVKVSFENASDKAYGNTVGMLGDYKTGKTVGRDGVTEIHDFTDFGHEWQVLPADGKLFSAVSHPQFPELCVDPEDPRGDRKRRLVESAVSIEDAEAACASLKDELDRKDCVYDIIATQDMDMVGAY